MRDDLKAALRSLNASRTFTVVALIYFAVSFPITQIVGLLERRRQLLVS